MRKMPVRKEAFSLFKMVSQRSVSLVYNCFLSLKIAVYSFHNLDKSQVRIILIKKLESFLQFRMAAEIAGTAEGGGIS